MRNFKLLLLAFIALLGITSCSTHNVQEGHKGLIIKRPYIFGSDGVDVVDPGRAVIAWTSDVVEVDIRPFKAEEQFTDLNTHNNVPVDFKIYYTISVDPDKVHLLYSTFGMDYYEKSIRQELCNLTRDKCKTYEMNPLTNDPRVSQEINEFVLTEGNKIIKKMGIPVTLKAVNMGAVNPPDQVTNERANTAAAVQKEMTIIQETKNQVSRQSSEKERAKADKAYQDALGLTTEQYMTLQKLRVKEIGYSKAQTVTIIEGSAGLTKIVE